MRRILFASLALGLAAGPAGALDVRQMKQRIENAVNGKDQGLIAAAEKAICKTDKKPICYGDPNGWFIDSGYGIVKVVRPEENKAFYILMQSTRTGWNPMFARTMEFLSLAKWQQERVMIDPEIAKRLIQKMLPLR